MKFVLILSVLVVFATSSPVSQDRDNIAFLESRQDVGGHLKVDASKIKYVVFRQGSSKGSTVYSTDISKLKNTRFDASHESIYVIHGWTNNNASTINTSIRNALLSKYNVNIIIVDWSRYSRLDYVSSAARVSEVGRSIADFIKQTVSHFHVSLDKVRLVGFSLGAHVAGSAGKALNGQVASIIGLDPAGPGFYKAISASRLDSSDAKYVQGIHTNSGTLGCTFAVGHSDFWVNGGSSQAGCVVDMTGMCSHNRVYALYAESLTDNNFVARKCDSYIRYSTGLCRNEQTSHMGGIHPNTKAQGDYFLDTNKRSPYGKN